GVDLRSVTRQAMKISNRNRAFALGAAHPYSRVKCDQRHAHVGWMSGNAFVAGAENCVVTIESFQSAAPASGRTLVALRRARIHEIPASGALQQVSAIGREISKLRRSAGKNCARQQRVMLPHQWMVCSVTISGEGAET